MQVRTTFRIARDATYVIRQCRYASTTADITVPKSTEETEIFERNKQGFLIDKTAHGEQIWVYTHLQKHHVVYSLTKILKNNKSIKQLPYNGKKTVPPALRKDLWYPMCTLKFIGPSTTSESSASPSTSTTETDSRPPSSQIGLSIYQKLRELRRRHELEWEESDYLDKEGNFMTRKSRGRKLCDQRANSVADISYMLSRLRLLGPGESFDPPAPAADSMPATTTATDKVTDVEPTTKKGSIGLVGEGLGEQVELKWWNITDAEWASTWSDNVVHGWLEQRVPDDEHEMEMGRAADFKAEEARINAERAEKLRLENLTDVERKAERVARRKAMRKADRREVNQAKKADYLANIARQWEEKSPTERETIRLAARAARMAKHENLQPQLNAA